MKVFTFLLVAGFMFVVLADPLNYEIQEANIVEADEAEVVGDPLNYDIEEAYNNVEEDVPEGSGGGSGGGSGESPGVEAMVVGSEYAEERSLADEDEMEDNFDEREEEEDLPGDLDEDAEYEEEQRELDEEENVEAAEELESVEQRSELEGEMENYDDQYDEVRSFEDLLDEANAEETDKDIEQQKFEDSRDVPETDETEKEDYERELQELRKDSETADNYEEESFQELEETDNNAEKRKRFIWEWRYKTLLRRVTGKWYRLKGYGCYCGSAGKGKPVDEIDKCCQVRQECNANRTKTYTERGVWGWSWTCDRFAYSCRGPADGQMTCKCRNINKCRRAACGCQLRFAECVKKNMKVYDRENVGISDTCK